VHRLRTWRLAAVALAAPIVFVGCASRDTPSYDWNFGVIPQYLPALGQGLVVTIALTILIIVVGMSLGVVVAGARLSRFAVLRWLTTGYVEVMRCTPTLVQLVWAYYCLPILFGIQVPAFAAIAFALILNTGAFYGEAFRAGIQSIPRDQVETADILGLSYFQRMRYVIVPLTVRIVLPVLISLSIGLFKETSLVSTLGVADLMYQGKLVATATYRPLEILTTVALIYFLVAFPVTLLARRLEIHLSRYRAVAA